MNNLSDGMQCTVYHPLSLQGEQINISSELKIALCEFIGQHDRTHTGNITELTFKSLERILAMPCFITVLTQETAIIGTLINLIFRAQVQGKETYMTYSTFLCVHTSFRHQKLAKVLVQTAMKALIDRYHITQGYYLTADLHQGHSNTIESWYRPLNVAKTLSAGFQLLNFPSSLRQRLAYHIAKPIVLPIKVIGASYTLTRNILNTGTISLCPSKQEFKWLAACFDIYTVGDYGLFLLFPMRTHIATTGKYVMNAQLALMIGDVMPQVLWAAQESGYDLLYGWYAGDITINRVTAVRGLTTVAQSYIEYNMETTTPNDTIFLPLV